jgi:hypothetical protein
MVVENLLRVIEEVKRSGKVLGNFNATFRINHTPLMSLGLSHSATAFIKL